MSPKAVHDLQRIFQWTPNDPKVHDMTRWVMEIMTDAYMRILTITFCSRWSCPSLSKISTFVVSIRTCNLSRGTLHFIPAPNSLPVITERRTIKNGFFRSQIGIKFHWNQKFPHWIIRFFIPEKRLFFLDAATWDHLLIIQKCSFRNIDMIPTLSFEIHFRFSFFVMRLWRHSFPVRNQIISG
jgi:hypothetical protein